MGWQPGSRGKNNSSPGLSNDNGSSGENQAHFIKMCGWVGVWVGGLTIFCSTPYKETSTICSALWQDSEFCRYKYSSNDDFWRTYYFPKIFRYGHTLWPLPSFIMLAFSLRPKIKNKPPFSGQINGGAAWPRDLIQRSTQYWVKVSNFPSQAALKSNTSRWDDSKLSSEERLNFATCLTFCVQTTLARVATLPLSTLVSSLQCSYWLLSSITLLCSFVRPYGFLHFKMQICVPVQAEKQRLDQLLHCLAILSESRAYNYCSPFHKVPPTFWIILECLQQLNQSVRVALSCLGIQLNV